MVGFLFLLTSTFSCYIRISQEAMVLNNNNNNNTVLRTTTIPFRFGIKFVQ